MNCKKFLQLAKKLKEGNKAEEVEFRTSISRAFQYLYIFIKRKYRNDRRVTFKDDNIDKKTIAELFRIAKNRQLVSEWTTYREDRNNAEYNMDFEFDKTDADTYIEDIEKFINDVNRSVKVKKRRH